MSSDNTNPDSADPDVRKVTAVAENQPTQRGTLSSRILVVEDSPTQAQQLQFQLEAEGYAVEVAVDGQKGFDRVNAADFALVISDILMPGLSGYELCRKIKAHPAKGRVPVILLTSLTDPMDIIQGLECGADNFITKPYHGEDLVSRVQSILENISQRSEGKI